MQVYDMQCVAYVTGVTCAAALAGKAPRPPSLPGTYVAGDDD